MCVVCLEYIIMQYITGALIIMQPLNIIIMHFKIVERSFNGPCSKCPRISLPLWLVRFCTCARTIYIAMHACAVLTSCYLPGHKRCRRCLQLIGIRSSFFSISASLWEAWIRMGCGLYPQVCRWPQLGRSRVRSKVRGQWPTRCKHPPLLIMTELDRLIQGVELAPITME